MAANPRMIVSQTCVRAFHTSNAICHARQRGREPIPTPVPAYVHGPRRWYKQANTGLYGNLAIRTGNRVSEQNEIKTPRKWRPNLHCKRLWSDAVNRFVRVRVVTRVLRTIDKVGGLDNYLLGDAKGRIRELGVTGWALRWRLWHTEMVRTRLQETRDQMGLQGPAPWEMAGHVLGTLGERIRLPPPPRRLGQLSPASSITDDRSMSEAADEMLKRIDEQLDTDDAAAQRGEDGGMDLHDELDNGSVHRKLGVV